MISPTYNDSLDQTNPYKYSIIPHLMLEYYHQVIMFVEAFSRGDLKQFLFSLRFVSEPYTTNVGTFYTNKQF